MKAGWKLYAGALTLLIACLPSAQAGSIGSIRAWEELRSNSQETVLPVYYYRRHYGYHRPYYGYGYRRPYYGYRRHYYRRYY
jgi:hypothetical protein